MTREIARRRSRSLGLAAALLAAGCATVVEVPVETPLQSKIDVSRFRRVLVAGFATEYSGMRFGFFFFAEYVNVFVVSALLVTLFFGGWNAPFPWPWPVSLSLDPGSLAIGLLVTGAGLHLAGMFRPSLAAAVAVFLKLALMPVLAIALALIALIGWSLLRIDRGEGRSARAGRSRRPRAELG